MALRGHASIQGSTDIPTLFNLLPGYLPMPHAAEHDDLRRVPGQHPAPEPEGLLGQRRRLHRSACSRRTGATRRRRRTTSASTTCRGSPATTAPTARCMDMVDGKVSGYFLLGQNPAVGSAHGRLQRLGMANLDWLVVRDLRDDRDRHVLEGRAGDRDRRDRARAVPHRGVLLAGRLARGEGGHLHPDPAAAAVAGQGGRAAGRRSAPSCGSSTTSGRHAQGAAGRLDRRRATGRCWTWPGTTPTRRRPTPSRAPRRCCGEINGYDVATGRAADGVHRAEGRRLHRVRLLDLHRGLRRRGQPGRAPQAGWEQDPYAAEWGWAWPANRRVLYNRASADPDGKPWSERKKLVWWDAGAGRVDRRRRPGLRADQAAGLRAAARAPTGPAALRGDDPFIMQADGKGWLFAPSGAGGRAAAHALRAARVAGAQPALRPAGQPDPQGLRAPGQPVEPEPAARSTRGLPVRVHRQPAHRAPHGGRDEPARCRTCRSCSRSCSSRCRRSWPPSAGWRTWAGRTSSPAARRSRRGCWSPTGWRRCASAAAWCTRSGCRTTGAATGLVTGDVGQRPVRRRRWTRTSHPGEQGRPPATSGPGRRPRGPALLDLRRRTTAGAPGIDRRPDRHPSLDHRRGARPHRSTDERRRGAPEDVMTGRNSLSGPLADAPATPGYTDEHPPRVGLLHRHLGLHRLQGLRGGLQGVERRPRGRARPARHVVRQHRRAGREHLAARRVHRAAARPGARTRRSAGLPTGRRRRHLRPRPSAAAARHATRGGGELGTQPCRRRRQRGQPACSTGPEDLGMPGVHPPGDGTARRAARLPLADGVGRLQALHARRLPRRLPDRRAVPHRVRHGRRAGGHLQRLRLLRAGCPYGVIDRRKDDGRALEVHAVLRPADDGHDAGLRAGLPDAVHPVRRPRRAAGAGRPRGWRRCTTQGVTEARLYGHDPDDGVGGDGAFFLLLDEPEVYGLPPDPVVPTRDAAVDVAARGRGRRRRSRWPGSARSSAAVGGRR